MKKTTILSLVFCVAISLSACTDAGENKVTTKAEQAPEKPEERVMPTEDLQNNKKTYFIGPKRVDCMGVAPQKCLQVKNQKDEEWTLFYSAIEGFIFEEGYTYEIVVSTEKIANPPMDSSSVRYKLVHIVSKAPAQ